MAQFGGMGALMGQTLNLAGRGAGTVDRFKDDEQQRRARLAETSSLARALQNQQNTDRQFANADRGFNEGVRRADRGYAEGVRRYDAGQARQVQRDAIGDEYRTEQVKVQAERNRINDNRNTDIFTRQGDWHEDQSKRRDKEFKALQDYRGQQLLAAGIKANRPTRQQIKAQAEARQALVLGSVDGAGSAIEGFMDSSLAGNRKDLRDDPAHTALAQNVDVLHSQSGANFMVGKTQLISSELENLTHNIKKAREMVRFRGQNYAESAKRYGVGREEMYDALGFLAMLSKKMPLNKSMKRRKESMHALLNKLDEEFVNDPVVKGQIDISQSTKNIDNFIAKRGQ